MLSVEDQEIIRQLIRKVVREETPAIAEAIVLKMRDLENRILDSNYELQCLPEKERRRRKRQMMLAENKERKLREGKGV